MSLREKEDALFDRWEATVCDGGFVRDGAGREFETQSFRLLFILKEPNDTDKGRWDMRAKIIDTGNQWRSWNNIARWAAHILTGATWPSVAKIDQEARRGYLAKIAAMNLKKVGGGASSDLSDVREWAISNADYLHEQAALYEPHLTILGGNFEIVREVFNLKGKPEHDGDPNIDKYVPATPLGTILNFYHPQYRQPARKSFEQMERDITHLRNEQLLHDRNNAAS